MATQAGPGRPGPEKSGNQKLTLGQPAPDFTLPSLDGRQIGLRDYRGHKLIVFMWASW